MIPSPFRRPKAKSAKEIRDAAVSLVQATVTEVAAARGNTEAIQAAFNNLFQRGAKAELPVSDLLDLVPIVFVNAGFSQEEALQAMSAVKPLTDELKAGKS